ncbi:hypothetical protein TNCV_2662651 [Trichonephila clavipes]|nr:hypothetical protein TNCV_2662651 [Trichonephila clavipes]
MLSGNKKQITAHLFSLMQIGNGTAMLNGLLHPNVYKGRRVTLCIEVLPTTPHSALDIGTVAKPSNEKLQQSLYFFNSYY